MHNLHINAFEVVRAQDIDLNGLYRLINFCTLDEVDLNIGEYVMSVYFQKDSGRYNLYVNKYSHPQTIGLMGRSGNETIEYIESFCNDPVKFIASHL